jgi:hypothetical protein
MSEHKNKIAINQKEINTFFFGFWSFYFYYLKGELAYYAL